MGLAWTEDKDDYDNTYYEAWAMVEDEFGGALVWDVRQSLRGDRIAWTLEESDPELVSAEAAEERFGSAEAAKLWCERREAELLAKEATT